MAEDDPLAKWRRPGSQPVQAPAKETGGGKGSDTVVELEDYRADSGENRAGGWLEFRPKSGPWQLLHLSQLRKILFNGRKPTRVDLMFTSDLVTTRGRNLRPLITGLRTRSLGAIEEFNPDTHEKPEGDETAIVESMEIKPIDSRGPKSNGPGKDDGWE